MVKWNSKELPCNVLITIHNGPWLGAEMNRIQHGTDCSYGMENSGGGMAAPSKSAVAANKNSNPVARKFSHWEEKQW